MHNLELATPYIHATPATKIHSNIATLIGHGFDGTVSYRPGSRFGPNAIREASQNLETFSPYLQKDLEDLTIHDCGNLPFHPSDWQVGQKVLTELFQKSAPKHPRIILLGGEHTVSLCNSLLYLHHYPDLVILHLDAHADLRDEYLGNPYSHACTVKRMLDHFSPGNELLQYGIRSCTKEEFSLMDKMKTKCTSLNELKNRLAHIHEDRPIYLTLDLDFFDPAFLPGTGTPEAGGASFGDFISIVKILQNMNFVGGDVVELAPSIDPTGNSSCFASKVTREIILSLRHLD